MDYRTIKLTKGKFAIIDSEDFERLSQWKWHFHSSGYAVRGGNYYNPNRKIPKIYMHREILNAPRGVQIDHKSGNGLDNRKQNLRLCTRSQNHMNARRSSANKSGYKGVAWHKRSKTYQAYINVGRFICLGYFKNPKEAAKIYNDAAIKYFGEFAKLNQL